MQKTVEFLSKRDAIKIIYYLMTVDGNVCQGEEEKFDLLASAIDPTFDKHGIKLECQRQLAKVNDDFYSNSSLYDIVLEGVSDSIDNAADMSLNQHSGISSKILLWNLLVIAFSDGAYTEEEKKLIMYVTRKMEIPKKDYYEMESAIKALDILDRQENYLKSANRPYVVIEAQINELKDRRGVIYNSIEELLSI